MQIIKPDDLLENVFVILMFRAVTYFYIVLRLSNTTQSRHVLNIPAIPNIRDAFFGVRVRDVNNILTYNCTYSILQREGIT